MVINTLIKEDKIVYCTASIFPNENQKEFIEKLRPFDRYKSI